MMKQKYWCYHPHWSRNLVSPVFEIFLFTFLILTNNVHLQAIQRYAHPKLWKAKGYMCQTRNTDKWHISPQLRACSMVAQSMVRSNLDNLFKTNKNLLIYCLSRRLDHRALAGPSCATQPLSNDWIQIIKKKYFRSILTTSFKLKIKVLT